MYDTIPKPELALTIGLSKKGDSREQAQENMRELVSLAKTAGADVFDSMMQELDKPNPATAIGKGKVAEIKEIIEQNETTWLRRKFVIWSGSSTLKCWIAAD